MSSSTCFPLPNDDATLSTGRSRTITETDVALFIGVTWDVNPLHTDESYARLTRFGRRIVPGLLTASLVTHLGGLWAFMATDMHFEFLGPAEVDVRFYRTGQELFFQGHMHSRVAGVCANHHNAARRLKLCHGVRLL